MTGRDSTWFGTAVALGAILGAALTVLLRGAVPAAGSTCPTGRSARRG